MPLFCFKSPNGKRPIDSEQEKPEGLSSRGSQALGGTTRELHEIVLQRRYGIHPAQQLSACCLGTG